MKPIALLDLETTGAEIDSARIVQISVRQVDQNFIPLALAKTILLNPGIPISAEATEIHGITDEMVKECPSFKKISKSLHEYLMPCDAAGFNILGFDIPVLAEEFIRVGMQFPPPGMRFIDAMAIFHTKVPRTLSGAAIYFLNKEHVEAHDAEADIDITREILVAQVNRYEDLKAMDIQQLHKFCQGDQQRVDLAGTIVINAEGVPVYKIGKDKGKPIKANPGFAYWMLKNSFSTDTKNHLKKILYGR
jgi:DNA polymerase-3 subunit epsilon